MEEFTQSEISCLGEEWLHLQFSTDDKFYSKVFTDISMFDYFILKFLKEKMGFGYEKIYLKEIAEMLDKPINQVSTMVQHLQNQGVVEWKHDENGTFIQLSKRGSEKLQNQKIRIHRYFEKVICSYGVDKFKKLVELRKEFNEMVEDVI